MPCALRFHGCPTTGSSRAARAWLAARSPPPAAHSGPRSLLGRLHEPCGALTVWAAARPPMAVQAPTPSCRTRAAAAATCNLARRAAGALVTHGGPASLRCWPAADPLPAAHGPLRAASDAPPHGRAHGRRLSACRGPAGLRPPGPCAICVCKHREARAPYVCVCVSVLCGTVRATRTCKHVHVHVHVHVTCASSARHVRHIHA